MGLFGFGKKKRQREEAARMARHTSDASVQPSNLLAATPWYNVELVGAKTVTGPGYVKLYTFNGKPLEGIPDGERFKLRVLFSDVVVQSRHSATRWDTARDGDVPVAYNGVFVGLLALDRELMMEKGREGYVFDFEAYLDGTVPGYSNVRRAHVMCPHGRQSEWIPGL